MAIKVKASFKTMLGEGKTFTDTFTTTCRKPERAIEAVTKHIVFDRRGFDVKILDTYKA